MIGGKLTPRGNLPYAMGPIVQRTPQMRDMMPPQSTSEFSTPRTPGKHTQPDIPQLDLHRVNSGRMAFDDSLNDFDTMSTVSSSTIGLPGITFNIEDLSNSARRIVHEVVKRVMDILQPIPNMVVHVQAIRDRIHEDQCVIYIDNIMSYAGNQVYTVMSQCFRNYYVDSYQHPGNFRISIALHGI